MTISKAERLATLHAEALQEFNDIQVACRDVRMQCLQARRFYSIPGAQWEGALGDQFENKPRFEFNKVHLAVIRIINEYRNNRITVDFQSKDGSKDDKLADTCDGLYRADYQACSGDEAVDNAFEEGTGGGFGAWRLSSCYEDEDDDEDDRQRVTIEPIFDADSCVFFDLGAKRQDKADAKRCWVLTPYPRNAYEEEFDDDPTTWPRPINQSQFDWSTPDYVWVAEFYQVEESKQLVHFFQGLLAGGEEKRVADEDLDEQLQEELDATGWHKVREKRITRRRVHKYLMSGGKILEDCGFIPGRCIPIVPFFGKRWVVDGIERCTGHVQLAMDAQRLINMLMSWLAEMAARFDVEKPIFSPEQMAGHAQMWAEDNVKKFPYLLANQSVDASTGNPIPGTQAPVAYTKAPNVPPAWAALAQMASQALEDMLGNQQAGEQMQPNLSGKAVELIQNRLDMQVFIYMSNLAKAKKREGEIWLSMMKDIAHEKNRRMKTIDSEGKAGSVVLNRPIYDADAGKDRVENDMTEASFDVVADVGPSSGSQRAATVRALTGAAQFTDDPETKQALTLATISNLEGEGLSDLRDWARRKAVRMGVVKPTDEESQEMQQEMANQQPDPQAQYLLAAAQQAAADAGKSRAQTVQSIADADLKRAQTAKTMAETMGEHNEQQIASAQALQGLLQPRMPVAA